MLVGSFQREKNVTLQDFRVKEKPARDEPAFSFVCEA